MLRLICVGVIGLLLILFSWVAETAMTVSAQSAGSVGIVVQRVENGESLRVLFGGGERSLRLDGVQIAPCMAGEAADRLQELAAGRAALLDYDRGLYGTSGQLAGYAWVDGVMLNLILISEGYGKRAGGSANAVFDREAAAGERVAQSQRLGLWSRCPG